jgi:hypothetical protein
MKRSNANKPTPNSTHTTNLAKGDATPDEICEQLHLIRNNKTADELPEDCQVSLDPAEEKVIVCNIYSFLLSGMSRTFARRIQHTYDDLCAPYWQGISRPQI